MGKSKELAELGQVVTQSNGYVGFAKDNPTHALHLGGGSNFLRRTLIEDTSTPGQNAGHMFRLAKPDGSTTSAGYYFQPQDGNSSFLGLSADNINYHLKVNQSGHVTMPYQPAFSAYGTGILSWASGSYALKIVPLVYAQNNIGGHFSTSTYRFTAPVTGSYYFSAKATQTNSATGPSLVFTKNGAVFGYEASIGYYTAYHSFTGSTVMHLNANDYVSIYIGNNNYVAMDIDLGRSSFSGYLIG